MTNPYYAPVPLPGYMLEPYQHYVESLDCILIMTPRPDGTYQPWFFQPDMAERRLMVEYDRSDGSMLFWREDRAHPQALVPVRRL